MTTNAVVSVPAPDDRSSIPEPLEKKWEEMPLPQSVQSFLLMAIFTLLTFYTLYFTSEVVLPIIFAVVLNLLLQPSMRWLVRLHLPRVVAALLMITVFLGGLTALGLTLPGPA